MKKCFQVISFTKITKFTKISKVYEGLVIMSYRDHFLDLSTT